MSEIDRIEDNAVAAIRDAINNGDDFRVWVRAALIEYGEIVREECATKCVKIEMRYHEKFRRPSTGGDPYDEGAAEGACDCAAAIREK